MKLLFIITTLYYTSIKQTFGQCSNSSDRRLGIRTTDVPGAASGDSNIFAAVYSNDQWFGWRALNNIGCNDFVRGETDYFNDFEGITGEWEGIALFNCGNDGLKIETVYYWDGTKQEVCTTWRAGVFGPFQTRCLFDNAQIGDPVNPSTFVYSDIYIDGDHFGNDCCRGVVFAPDPAIVPHRGQVWTNVELPGIPDCSQAEFGEAPAIFPLRHDEPSNDIDHKYGVHTDFVIMEQQLQQLSNYMTVLIGISVLLFALVICLIIVMVRKPRTGYGKVKEYDSEA